MIRNHSRHGSRFPITLGGGGGYSVAKSLRFRSSASAYLNRTLTTPTSSTIYTWSGWVKRGALSATGYLFGASTTTNFGFNSSDQLLLTLSGTAAVTTTAVYRDPAAWYHLVYVQNGATQTIYVNGVSAGTGTTANTVFNTAIAHQLAAANTTSYFDGELAEVNFVDGQALAPTSFGASSTYNQWLPIAYAGTYGTNGFYLPFTNTTSTSTLVADSSGNANNWTPNNISLTAGSTYDSLTDVPTLTSTTVANYAVLNPLSTNQFGGSATLTNGNLTVAVASSSANVAFATLPCSGKNYMETLGGSFGSGVLAIQCFSLSGLQGAGYYSDGRIFVNNALVSTYATFTGADVISCDIDTSTRQIRFYKNNTQIGSTATATGTDALYFAVSGSGAGTGSPSTNVNFGQQPFTYTPPSGFLPLNTFNIAAGTVTTSGTFTGNLSTDGPMVFLNGTPTAMTINGNAVTFGTQADKLANGFKVRSSSASYNASGSNTYSASVVGAVFKYEDAQSNP